MTNTELEELFVNNTRRVDEIEEKYRTAGKLTRREANDLRRAVQRIGIVAWELWLLNGQPDDFPDWIKQPIPLSSLPASMCPLDLTSKPLGGVN